MNDGLNKRFYLLFLAEHFLESMQVHVSGMTLVDAATLTAEAANQATTVDIRQAASCIASLMMQGNIYRFGTGWFFSGLRGIVLAPADILIILLAGAATWLILGTARKRVDWPAQRTATVLLALCAAVALAGPLIAISSPKNVKENISGCYILAENLYTTPLSSSIALPGMPLVYGFTENVFIIADTQSGHLSSYSIEYVKTPVSANEFSSKAEFSTLPGSLFMLPGLGKLKERYLLAVMRGGSGDQEYGLYRMDKELWLVKPGKADIWSIYRLEKTDATTTADLERALKHYAKAPPDLLSGFYEKQMTLRDVYALARKGEALTLDDFEPFFYLLTGPDFTTRLYEVAYADSIKVHAGQGGLQSALLASARTHDPAQVIDLREGFAAVAAYLDPLKAFRRLGIEGSLAGGPEGEMFFEDDYFGSNCRYYLSSGRAANIFAVFEDGERLTLTQALQERRTNVEELAANGLSNVRMIPIDNPLGGEFMILHHQHLFELEGEVFYPSKSFMYVIAGNYLTAYYDINELSQFLELYGYSAAAAQLRQACGPADITAIADGNYISEDTLAAAAIEAEAGWNNSAYTPVSFRLMIAE